MGQGHNNQGTTDVDIVHMSVSRLVNTWQGHQVPPLEAVLGNSSSDFNQTHPHFKSKLQNAQHCLTVYTDKWAPVKYIM